MGKYELGFLSDYSDDAVLEEVRRVAALVDKRVLTKAEFSRHAKVSVRTLQARFGDWRCVLERASLGHLYSGKPVTERMRHTGTRQLSSQDMIRLMQRAAEELGRTTLLRAEFERITGISKGAILSRFGCWKNAVRQAGLQSHPRTSRYSDDLCYINLLEVWTHYGRCPRGEEMNRSPSMVSRATYIQRWGTWRMALAAFVEWESSNDTDSILRERQIRSSDQRARS